jgi:dipeptidyl aminopeptidase/acylaminoacyl peptidase
VLDHLVREGYADPTRVAASGTSRGAFAAFHFAAADPRVRCVVGFSPLTDLIALTEFEGLAQPESAAALSLGHVSHRLADRPLWLCIGDDDQRVGTDRAVAFARSVAAASAEAGLSPRVDLHVMPSSGHAVPDGAHDMAVRWLREQMRPGA